MTPQDALIAVGIIVGAGAVLGLNAGLLAVLWIERKGRR